MGNNVLTEVIEAEKEIQKCVELEKEKVRKWLENVIKESEEEIAAEQRKITAYLNQSRAEASILSEAKAAEILDRARIDADRLQKLNTESLTGIIGKRIAGLLPG